MRQYTGGIIIGNHVLNFDWQFVFWKSVCAQMINKYHCVPASGCLSYLFLKSNVLYIFKEGNSISYV